MKYWAGLHNAADREALHAGADALMNIASSTTPGVGTRTQRRLEDAEDES